MRTNVKTNNKTNIKTNIRLVHLEFEEVESFRDENTYLAKLSGPSFNFLNKNNLLREEDLFRNKSDYPNGIAWIFLEAEERPPCKTDFEDFNIPTADVPVEIYRRGEHINFVFRAELSVVLFNKHGQLVRQYKYKGQKWWAQVFKTKVWLYDFDEHQPVGTAKNATGNSKRHQPIRYPSGSPAPDPVSLNFDNFFKKGREIKVSDAPTEKSQDKIRKITYELETNDPFQEQPLPQGQQQRPPQQGGMMVGPDHPLFSPVPRKDIYLDQQGNNPHDDCKELYELVGRKCAQIERKKREIAQLEKDLEILTFELADLVNQTLD